MSRASHAIDPVIQIEQDEFRFGSLASLRPANFVEYLLTEHRENGKISPIPRKEFESMLGVREHYFSELFSDKPGQLPWPLAVALANMTKTKPYFWQKTDYTRDDALGINLKLVTLNEGQKSQFTYSKLGKARPIALVDKSHRMMQGSEETFTPHEFLRYVLDNAHQGHQSYPISRQTFSLKFSSQSRQLDYDENSYVPGKRLPKKTIAALTQLSNRTDPEFWKKTAFTLADTVGIEIDMTKKIQLQRGDQFAAATR